jgi:hypothetical protein
VSVEELQRGWAAIQAGCFRPGRRIPAGAFDLGNSAALTAAPGDGEAWAPAEPVVTVVGCAGSSGASTLALAIALAAPSQGRGQRVRVVECAPAIASGLAGASSAELGPAADTGWQRGTRREQFEQTVSEVVLERATQTWSTPLEVALPADPVGSLALTVLDVSWPTRQLLAGADCWLRQHLETTTCLVAVTRATVPGILALEGSLEILARHHQQPGAVTTVAAVLGPRGRRWPKPVAHAAGPLTRALAAAGLLIDVPVDPGLAVAGVGSAPLPRPVLASGAAVARLVDPGPGNPSPAADHATVHLPGQYTAGEQPEREQP